MSNISSTLSLSSSSSSSLSSSSSTPSSSSSSMYSERIRSTQAIALHIFLKVPKEDLSLDFYQNLITAITIFNSCLQKEYENTFKPFMKLFKSKYSDLNQRTDLSAFQKLHIEKTLVQLGQLEPFLAESEIDSTSSSSSLDLKRIRSIQVLIQHILPNVPKKDLSLNFYQDLIRSFITFSSFSQKECRNSFKPFIVLLRFKYSDLTKKTDLSASQKLHIEKTLVRLDQLENELNSTSSSSSSSLDWDSIRSTQTIMQYILLKVPKEDHSLDFYQDLIKYFKIFDSFSLEQYENSLKPFITLFTAKYSDFAQRPDLSPSQKLHIKKTLLLLSLSECAPFLSKNSIKNYISSTLLNPAKREEIKEKITLKDYLTDLILGKK